MRTNEVQKNEQEKRENLHLQEVDYQDVRKQTPPAKHAEGVERLSTDENRSIQRRMLIVASCPRRPFQNKKPQLRALSQLLR